MGEGRPAPPAGPQAAPATPATLARGPFNLAAALEARARSRGWMGRPAFLTGDRSWSHADVHEHGHAVAGFMAAAGVSPGDRVLLALSDRIELVWALLGAVRAGAVAVLVNPLLTEADHAFMVADTAPALVVCEEALTQRFDSEARTVAAAGLPRGGGIEVPAVDVTAEAAAYAQYTSGTTGPPKAALHRHSDPAGYHTAMGQGVLRLRPDDVVCSISKAYFAYGLGNSVFFPLFSGCAAVLEAGKPTAGRVGTIVARHRATVLFAVPSFYARLVAEGDAACFGSVRLAVSAGEALQPALYHRAQAWLGREVLDGLGSTEVGQTFISNLPGSSRPGTMGKVLPGYDAAICDDTGARVPAGEVGGLWVRGPTVMLGYLNRPDETAAVLVDGWCRTGDRASVDEDGYYRHHGRMDDLEVVGGINVSPLEIEAVLLEHPAVVEVAVASVPDETGASRLRCFAVLDAGTAWSPGLQAEILALPRSRLAAFKVPRSVTAVDSLPRTMTGKLRRHVLRAGWPAAPGGRAH